MTTNQQKTVHSKSVDKFKVTLPVLLKPLSNVLKSRSTMAPVPEAWMLAMFSGQCAVLVIQ